MEKHEEDYNSDWTANEARVRTSGRTVVFNTYTAGYLSHVEYTLKKLKPVKPLKIYRDYQEIRITLVVSKGVTMKTMPLVMDPEDASAVRWLIDQCGPPKRAKQGDKEVLEWFYRGNRIFSDVEATLWAGDVAINLDEKKYWNVDF